MHVVSFLRFCFFFVLCRPARADPVDMQQDELEMFEKKKFNRNYHDEI